MGKLGIEWQRWREGSRLRALFFSGPRVTTGRRRVELPKPCRMHKPASLILGVALCGLLGADASAALPTTKRAAPAQPTQAAPAKRARPKVALQKIERPLTRKQLRPPKNDEASAALADLLVRIADGTVETKLEKRLVKKLGRKPATRAALERLSKRWKAASDDQLRKAIGRVELGSKPQKLVLQKAAANAKPNIFWMLRPTIPMPPESVPKPASYELELSGIQTIATHDADGSDELSTLTIFATPNGNAYDLVTVTGDGTITAPNATTTGLGKTLYDGTEKGMVVISVLVEDEGGNAAASLQEAAVMVDLAAGVAETLNGDDRLAVLKAMVDYTVGLQNLGADPQAATRSIASVSLAAADWYALWGTDPQVNDGVKWKLAVPHSIGNGQYELFLDVPSVLPDMATVKVAIDKFWRDDDTPIHPNYEIHRLRLGIGVKGASEILRLDLGETSIDWAPVYERKVLAGTVPLEFAAHIVIKQKDLPAGAETICGQHDFQIQGCHTFADTYSLDLATGAPTSREAEYSTATNKIIGTASNKLTTKGTNGYIGGLKITVTDVAAP